MVNVFGLHQLDKRAGEIDHPVFVALLDDVEQLALAAVEDVLLDRRRVEQNLERRDALDLLVKRGQELLVDDPAQVERQQLADLIPLGLRDEIVDAAGKVQGIVRRSFGQWIVIKNSKGDVNASPATHEAFATKKLAIDSISGVRGGTKKKAAKKRTTKKKKAAKKRTTKKNNPHKRTTKKVRKKKHPKTVHISGRRWRDANGNTYFSSTIFVDGKQVHRIPYAYGYGDQYADDSFEWLAKAGYIQPETGARGYEAPHRYAARKKMSFTTEATDVGRKKDL